jgi:hypothetical protein
MKSLNSKQRYILFVLVEVVLLILIIAGLLLILSFTA